MGNDIAAGLDYQRRGIAVDAHAGRRPERIVTGNGCMSDRTGESPDASTTAYDSCTIPDDKRTVPTNSNDRGPRRMGDGPAVERQVARFRGKRGDLERPTTYGTRQKHCVRIEFQRDRIRANGQGVNENVCASGDRVTGIGNGQRKLAVSSQSGTQPTAQLPGS